MKTRMSCTECRCSAVTKWLPPMEEDLEQQGEERDEQQQDHGQPLREPADDVRVDHLAAEVLGLAVLFGGFRAQGTAAAPVDRVAGRGDQIALLEQESRDAHLQRVAPRTVDHPGDRLQPPELFARPGHPDGRVLPQQVVVLVIPLADLERPQHVGIAQLRELLFPGAQRYIDILGDEERHGQEEECRDEHEQPQRVDIGIDLSGNELEGQYARAAEKEPEGLPHLAVELVDVLEILFEVFPEGLLRIERILSAAVAVHAPERLSAVLAVDICRHRMAAYAPQAVVFDPARQGSAPLLDPIAQRCAEALRRAAGCGVGRYSGGLLLLSARAFRIGCVGCGCCPRCLRIAGCGCGRRIRSVHAALRGGGVRCARGLFGGGALGGFHFGRSEKVIGDKDTIFRDFAIPKIVLSL